MHFVNRFIEELTEEFHIQHRKPTPYHPQVNGFVDTCNKILENALTKICNGQRDVWDQKISTVLWAYCTTCKKLTDHTPFRLVYVQEAMMLMEYIVLSLRITVITWMIDVDAVEERLL